MRYAAFLRGINVGGAKIIKMADLRAAFEAAGFARVATLKASGNVVFDAPSADAASVERILAKKFGEIAVCLRTAAQLKALVRRDPFKGRPDGTPYVVFLRDKAKGRPAFPSRSPDGTVEVLGAAALEVFCLSTGEGSRRTYPNPFVEKLLGVAATTRNWSTVRETSALAESAESC